MENQEKSNDELTLDSILENPTLKEVFEHMPSDKKEQFLKLKPKTQLLHLQICIEIHNLHYEMEHFLISRKECKQRDIMIRQMRFDCVMAEYDELICTYTYDIVFANKLAFYMLGTLPERMRELGFFEKFFKQDVKKAWNQLFKASDDKEDDFDVVLDGVYDEYQKYTPRLLQEMKGYISNLYNFTCNRVKELGVTDEKDAQIAGRIEACVLMCMYANDVFITRTNELYKISDVLSGYLDNFSIRQISSKAGNLCKAICNRIGPNLGTIDLDKEPIFVKISKDLDEKFCDEETRERILSRPAV